MSDDDDFDIGSLAATYHDGHPGPMRHPHSHRWAQLTYGLSGVMHVTAGDQVWFVPPTRAIWIPPGVTHDLLIRGEVAFRTLYVAPSRAGAAMRGVEALEVSPLLRELIVHIVGLSMLYPTREDHDRMAGVLMDLIASARGTDLSLPLPRDPRAVKLADHLRSEPGDKSGLSGLASRFGASLRTLQRCFADETGMTIEAWRQKARLVHSAAALSRGDSVTEAGIACGYDSVSAFIAAFRRQFGVTPGKFQTAR